MEPPLGSAARRIRAVRLSGSVLAELAARDGERGLLEPEGDAPALGLGGSSEDAHVRRGEVESQRVAFSGGIGRHGSARLWGGFRLGDPVGEMEDVTLQPVGHRASVFFCGPLEQISVCVGNHPDDS